MSKEKCYYLPCTFILVEHNKCLLGSLSKYKQNKHRLSAEDARTTAYPKISLERGREKKKKLNNSQASKTTPSPLLTVASCLVKIKKEVGVRPRKPTKTP